MQRGDYWSPHCTSRAPLTAPRLHADASELRVRRAPWSRPGTRPLQAAAAHAAPRGDTAGRVSAAPVRTRHPSEAAAPAAPP